MKSKPFNRKLVRQENVDLEQRPVQKDMSWEKKIEEMMQLGYSYKVAYAIISKRRIQELFDKDAKVNC